MDVNYKMKIYAEKVNKHIEDYLSKVEGIETSLLEAIKYSINSGGKRLRPMILILFYELFKRHSKCIYNIACAVEMIHTYSLIHDDLPCMDNDTMRRGKKCTHLVFGEDMALLSGDALITQAFEAMFLENNIQNIGEKALLSAAKILSEAAGSCGMVSGQVADLKMSKSKKVPNEDSIINMYKNKTGKLFSASAQIGVVCAGAEEKYLELAKNYGESLGIAFQLNDDIIDMADDCKDENKITYISVFGKDKTCIKAKEFTKQAAEHLAKFDGNTSFLLGITNLLGCREL